MAVELVNGSASLLIYSSIRDKPTRLHCSPLSSPLKLNDNKWHRIEIKYAKLGDFSPQMSTQPTATITFACDDSASRSKVPEQRLVGSVQFNAGNLSSPMPEDMWLAKETRFAGCIGGFRVNEREINLFDQTSADSRQTLERGCAESSGQCSRGGGNY